MALFIRSADPALPPLKEALEMGVSFRHLTSRLEQGVLLLTVTTPQLLDDALAEGFGPEVLAAVAAFQTPNVLLDLGGVKAVCSGVLAALVRLQGFLQARGGRLLLCQLSPPVAEVFRVTRLAGTDPESAAPLLTSRDVPSAVRRLNGLANAGADEPVYAV